MKEDKKTSTSALGEGESRKLKRLVIGLAVLFILFYLIGFLSEIENLFLLPLIPFLLLGIYLIQQTFVLSIEGKLKMFLLLTGFSSLLFSIGVMYGVMGIWGFYTIVDAVYLIALITSMSGFIIGMTRSLSLLKNRAKSKTQ